MKVMFVHPSHPNQFTRIAYGLAERSGWKCAFLVNEAFTAQVLRDDPPVAFYGFREDPLPADVSGGLYVQPLEEAARRGRAVADRLAAIHASFPFDVVVGHACFGTTFYARPLLGVPVVSYVELPGYFSVYSRREYPAVYGHLLMDVALRALIHESVLLSDLCIVPSRHALNLFPPELQPKIRVQMEGFSLSPPADKEALRRELDLPPGPVVGFAGRSLEAVRGFDVFVKVAKAVRRVRPDVRFLAIGEETTLYGNETAYLEGRSFVDRVLEDEGLSRGDILFRPFMDYGPFVRHLQAMDLFLFPLFEGAANWGLFEAMAAGLPVLASNRCFVPEVITDGRDGILLDPENVSGFVAATLAALDRPERCRALGQKARGTVARRFSQKGAQDGYAAILREALERVAGGSGAVRSAAA